MKKTRNTQTQTSNKSRQSKMNPVRQKPMQRTVRTAHLDVPTTVHNFSTQYSTEQLW